MKKKENLKYMEICFFGLDLDWTPILGFELGINVVVDFDNLSESGLNLCYGASGGDNWGIGLGGGYVQREFEGFSQVIDANAAWFGNNQIFDEQGYNGVAFTRALVLAHQFRNSIQKQSLSLIFSH
ncbi:MAG: hypothetical protein MZU97_08120 [Bacillus subtilis]|nr:hypothetical protein [Bacillus subtilis]